jgi:hypothetical protein
VERLKRFYGTLEEAKEAANIDYDQYEVDCILGYRGDPSRRSSMEFELLFKAGDTLWKRYCRDIYDTIYFEDFCRSRPELLPLLTTHALHVKAMATLNKTPITEVVPGDICYLNMRFYGYEKYKNFNLPNFERIIYVTKITYGNYYKNNTEIDVHVPLFKQKLKAKHEFVIMYGNYKNVNTQNNMRLVDESMLASCRK